MPFCPNCRSEYTPEAVACSDCGALLVESLPERASMPGSAEATRPVELIEVEDQVRLDMVETQLRAAHIPTIRRPRRVALFVPAAQLKSARYVLEGKTPGGVPEALELSSLHRIWLECEECDDGVLVDLLKDRLPDRCECGHYYNLSEARSVLERYADVMRAMANADFEIYVQMPEDEEE